ncbi:PREDICTED: C-C motif chemokine 3-like [Poecilia mexicana]|uniref:C-C motif chemokine 3-like n=1 Tax=Poecilia mexicana TaxID=48701 RepID=UPI00072DDA5E|nr:PREDICTED: C-C motif chemokine 3-like [Poecilia mexicana]
MQKVSQLHVALMVVLWISLVLTPCHSADSSGPDECCFEFFRNRLNKRLITSYYRTDARCRTNGIILITRRARRICVDSKDQWVQNIIKSLERKTL